MKQHFVADKTAVVNLQNLRWVRKSNTSYAKEVFDLELCYNVNHNPVMTIRYDGEKNRNSMYDTLVQELIARNKQ